MMRKECHLCGGFLAFMALEDMRGAFFGTVREARYQLPPWGSGFAATDGANFQMMEEDYGSDRFFSPSIAQKLGSLENQ